MPQAKNIRQIISPAQTADFAKKWTHNGVAIFQDATDIAFATDWVNVVLTSFIEQQEAKARAAAAPKVVSTEV